MLFTIISILLVLVVLFGASAVIGRLGNLRKTEHRAEANGDHEVAQALRKADSDSTWGRIYPH